MKMKNLIMAGLLTAVALAVGGCGSKATDEDSVEVVEELPSENEVDTTDVATEDEASEADEADTDEAVEGASDTSLLDVIAAEAVFPAEGMTDAIYVPGTYTTHFTLNDNEVDVEVTVDETNINDIQLVTNEEFATMYPLIQPSFDDLANQILESQSLENITIPDDSRYTSMILINAIVTSINKASISSSTP